MIREAGPSKNRRADSVFFPQQRYVINVPELLDLESV